MRNNASENISLTVQWNTNRKSYVAYRMAPLPIGLPLNDNEGHFCRLKPF